MVGAGDDAERSDEEERRRWNRPAAVAVTRADADMAAEISTVDDIDAEPGRITVILALHDLINGGHVGHYGTGHGAMSVTVSQ